MTHSTTVCPIFFGKNVGADSARSSRKARVWIVMLFCGLFLVREAVAADSWGTRDQRSPLQRIVQAGPVAPNASRVNAELLSLEIIDSSTIQISPPQTLTRLRMRILSIQSVESEINSLQGQEGRVIEALTKDSVDAHLIGKPITCIVTVRGDEHRRMNWARDINGLPRE